jgi:hypothetical protein
MQGISTEASFFTGLLKDLLQLKRFALGTAARKGMFGEMLNRFLKMGITIVMANDMKAIGLVESDRLGPGLGGF